MKFHLRKASDLSNKEIGVIKVNSLEELKDLPNKYKTNKDSPLNNDQRIIIDFDKSWYDNNDDTDGEIIIEIIREHKLPFYCLTIYLQWKIYVQL